MDDRSRTPLRTELRWFFGVLFAAGALAVGGALYILWRVFEAGAGC